MKASPGRRHPQKCPLRAFWGCAAAAGRAARTANLLQCVDAGPFRAVGRHNFEQDLGSSICGDCFPSGLRGWIRVPLAHPACARVPQLSCLSAARRPTRNFGPATHTERARAPATVEAGKARPPPPWKAVSQAGPQAAAPPIAHKYKTELPSFTSASIAQWQSVSPVN